MKLEVEISEDDFNAIKEFKLLGADVRCDQLSMVGDIVLSGVEF